MYWCSNLVVSTGGDIRSNSKTQRGDDVLMLQPCCLWCCLIRSNRMTGRWCTDAPTLLSLQGVIWEVTTEHSREMMYWSSNLVSSGVTEWQMMYWCSNLVVSTGGDIRSNSRTQQRDAFQGQRRLHRAGPSPREGIPDKKSIPWAHGVPVPAAASHHHHTGAHRCSVCDS